VGALREIDMPYSPQNYPAARRGQGYPGGINPRLAHFIGQRPDISPMLNVGGSRMKLTAKLIFIVFVLLSGCHSDLYTKQMARETLQDQPSVSLISGYLDLRYSENDGVAFSFLENVDESVRKPALASLQIFLSLVLGFLIFRWRDKPLTALLPFTLILAGAVGNAIDRVRFGHVVDFIHFHIQNSFSWPVFNVADILISAGLGLAVLQMILKKDTPLLTPSNQPE
jgi:signal peptidase II